MLIKSNVARSAIYLLFPFVRRFFKPMTLKYLTVFLFHEITDNPSSFQTEVSNYTTKENFQKSIDWIQRSYNIISIDQIYKIDQANSKPFALITFDDAWQGQLWAARYIKETYDLPFTLFLNFGTIYTKVDIAALRKYNINLVPTFKSLTYLKEDYKLVNTNFLKWQGTTLSLEDIRELSQFNKCTLSNHSLHHYSAIELSDPDFKRNVQLNEEELNEFNTFNKSYAFTYGSPGKDFTPNHVKILYALGYENVFSADAKLNSLPIDRCSLFSRINFSPRDSRSSDFWWATYKGVLLKRY